MGSDDVVAFSDPEGWYVDGMGMCPTTDEAIPSFPSGASSSTSTVSLSAVSNEVGTFAPVNSNASSSDEIK